MKIRYFEPGKSYLKIKDEIDREIHRVLAAGDLIMRKDLEEFEANMAVYLGVKYFVGVNSGTDALYIALRAAGIGPGDEVITVSHTFIATIEAIIRCGATPVLVDINDDGLMDKELTEKAITKKTKAIMPVHLTGDIVDIERLHGIIGDRDIFIIQDQAQALGAKI